MEKQISRVENELNNIQDKIINGLVSEIDLLIIKGLELKNYRFNTRDELKDFIKDKCSIRKSSRSPHHEYLCVNETPFLFINKEVEFKECDKNKITGHITYRFL